MNSNVCIRNKDVIIITRDKTPAFNILDYFVHRHMTSGELTENEFGKLVALYRSTNPCTHNFLIDLDVSHGC